MVDQMGETKQDDAEWNTLKEGELRRSRRKIGQIDFREEMQEVDVAWYEDIMRNVASGFKETKAKKETLGVLWRARRLVESKYETNAQVGELLLDVVEENMAEFEKYFSESNFVDGVRGLSLVAYLSKRRGKHKDALVEVVRRQKLRIIEGVESKKVKPFCKVLGYKLLMVLYENGDLNEKNKVLEIVNRGMRTENDRVLAGIVAGLLVGEHGIRHEGQELLQELVGKRYGLEIDRLVDSWSRSTKLEFLEDAVASNLRSIMYLEEKRPGAVSFLMGEFGVHCFSRYPVRLLVKQYDQREGRKKPYVLIMYPRDDHNGALYENVEAFDDLLFDVAGVYLVRAVEVGSVLEVGKMLVKLDNKYGKKRKIPMLIVGGHGQQHGIQFGSGEKKVHHLTVEHLKGKGVRRARKFFTDNVVVVLNSCKTGALGGIAQELSSLGAEVIAPKISTNLASIRWNLLRPLRLKPRYRERGAGMSYVEGRLSKRTS